MSTQAFQILDALLDEDASNEVRPDVSPMQRYAKKPWLRPNCSCEEPTGNPGPSICGFFYCTTCGGTVK